MPCRVRHPPRRDVPAPRLMRGARVSCAERSSSCAASRAMPCGESNGPLCIIKQPIHEDFSWVGPDAHTPCASGLRTCGLLAFAVAFLEIALVLAVFPIQVVICSLDALLDGWLGFLALKRWRP